MSPTPRRAVVVGAGIAGLTAARELAATGREVTVLEGSPRVGGKLLTGEVGRRLRGRRRRVDAGSAA